MKSLESGGAEYLIRYVDLTEAQRNSVHIVVDTIFGKNTGNPDPITPDWLAIVQVPTKRGKGGYLLYYVANDGTILNFDQYETFEIAVDQAHAEAGVERHLWKHCCIEFSTEVETFPRALIP